MPKDPPKDDPKVEILAELYEEQGATLEPAFPMTGSLCIDMGRFVCWNKRITMHVGHVQNVIG